MKKPTQTIQANIALSSNFRTADSFSQTRSWQEAEQRQCR